MPNPSGPGPIAALERRMNPRELAIDDTPTHYYHEATGETGRFSREDPTESSEQAVRSPKGDAHSEGDLQREPVHGPVCEFVEKYLLHYNGGELHRAAKAACDLLDRGGKLFLTIAGAASTAELGKIIAPLIDNGSVLGVSCTGANIEEDIFRLVGHKDYVELPLYQQLSREDDQTLERHNLPRVTDSSIPETAMKVVEEGLEPRWRAAQQQGQRFFWHEPFYDLLNSGALVDKYQKDPAESWMVSAARKQLPIIVPGAEDSSMGNHFQVGMRDGTYRPTLCRSGHEYMVDFSRWYQAAQKAHEIGFLQLGGGIAGDCPICVVPLLTKDARLKAIKKWAYFCQITDATESYGGYSGAMPTEKISWSKLDPKTPAFCVHSDFTIAFPLLGGYVLGM